MPTADLSTPTLAGRVAGSWRRLLHWPWRAAVRTLHQRFREDRLALAAGSLTFTTLIALVPLLTVMLAVFTAFPMFSSFQGALEKYFLQSLVPETIARPVLRALTQFAAKARGLGSIGLLIFGATALATMLTIDRTLNSIWRVARPRPIAQRVLVYWAALTLGPLVLGVSLSMTSYAISASRGIVGVLPLPVSALLNGIGVVLFTAALAGLFHYVPNTSVRWRHALAGALFAALAFEGAKKALAWYVETVPTYSAVYGAFATAPILMLWIYLGWVIVLLGALVAASAPGVQMGAGRRAAAVGGRFELALLLLNELASARSDAARGLTLDELARRLREDPLQIEPVLDWLIAADWVARIAEADPPRHVLLCDPQSTPAAPLVDALLLAPAEPTLRFRRRAGIDAMRLAELLG